MKRILTALMLTVVFAVPAFADMNGKEMKECACHEQKMGMPDMHRGMHKKGDMLGMLIKHADKVGLTDDQVVKLKAIHRTMEKKEIRAEAEKKITKIDLMEIMEVKDFNLEKADAAAKKISGIETSKHLEMLKTLKEVRSILTDEQFKKIKEMKSKMMEGAKCKTHKPMEHHPMEHHE